MPQLWSVTCHMGSHSVTCHPKQVNTSFLTMAGTRFTYPGWMEGWDDIVDLIAPRPGIEPATFRSRVRRRTAAPPRHKVRQLQGHVTTKIKSRGVSWAQGMPEKLRLEPTPEQLQRCGWPYVLWQGVWLWYIFIWFLFFPSPSTPGGDMHSHA